MGVPDRTIIYALCDPDNSTVRYVGKANNPIKRYSAHLSRAKSRKEHVYTWINSLIRAGRKPVLTLLEECSIHVWPETERKWIKHFKDLGNDLTNTMEGGYSGGATYGRLGKKNSPEHIQKTREGRIGKPVRRTPESYIRRLLGVRRFRKLTNRPVFQYQLSGEFVKRWNSSVEAALAISGRKDLSSNVLWACKGHPRSAMQFQWSYDHLQKIDPYIKKSPANKGRPLSRDTREKISRSKRGKKWTDARWAANNKRGELHA